MVNLIKYRDLGDLAGGNPALRSGREADDAYATTAIPCDIGAPIAFLRKDKNR